MSENDPPSGVAQAVGNVQGSVELRRRRSRVLVNPVAAEVSPRGRASGADRGTQKCEDRQVRGDAAGGAAVPYGDAPLLVPMSMKKDRRTTLLRVFRGINI